MVLLMNCVRLFLWTCFTAVATSKLLLLIPSDGYYWDGLDAILSNLIGIKTTVEFTCLLYYPNEIYFGVNESAVHKSISSACTIIPYYYVHYCDYIKAVPPYLIEKAGFSHVMVITTRLNLKPNIDIGNVLKIMGKNKLTIATGNANDTKQGYATDLLDNNVAIFTLVGWKCYYDLIDPKLNNKGYGVNSAVYNYCKKRIDNFKIGVLNELKYQLLSAPNISHYIPKYAINMTPLQQRFEWLAVMKERRNETIDEGNPRLYGNNGYGLK